VELQTRIPLSSRQAAGERQTRSLLWIGFGGLLLLMTILGLSALSFLYRIEIRHEQIRRDYVEREHILEKLRANIYLSGTYVRDFLLDPSDSVAQSRRSQFLDTRAEIESGMSDYARLLRPAERRAFAQLRAELNGYFAAIAPALLWTSNQRHTPAYAYLQDEVLSRRMVAIGLADDIQRVGEKELESSSQVVAELFTSFRTRLILLLALTLAIGAVLAGTALRRVLRLEREAQLRFLQVLNAQEELQKLSAELVSAQENERRRISRELHDEVGQMLSAVMLGLGNLGASIRAHDSPEALRQLQLVQDMTERNASVVRNISLLLRPTMLDDLGLVPALRWLAREVSRSTSISVEVAAEDIPEALPDEHRTCVYRVVQEALHNSSRHSGARHIRINVETHAGQKLIVEVRDDGCGFIAAENTGLGILGMEERVTRLGGRLHVDSARGKGTVVSFELPLGSA
jgi:signal transduction histidine kinase